MMLKNACTMLAPNALSARMNGTLAGRHDRRDCHRGRHHHQHQALCGFLGFLRRRRPVGKGDLAGHEEDRHDRRRRCRECRSGIGGVLSADRHRMRVFTIATAEATTTAAIATFASCEDPSPP